ncbi:MAG: SiaB family protein kinase [Bacteroidetes bacterium]|nr:SiaB family protein kinase [Bacteroidota bacterium]MBU1718220.1 SiaB family protein kinase [Bacteroidota bacterium]
MGNATILAQHEGIFTFEITEKLLDVTIENLKAHKVENTVIKKVRNIYAEIIENIQKYADWIPDYKGTIDPAYTCKSVIQMLNLSTGIGIEIMASNPIRMDEVGPLKARIDDINKRSSRKLRKTHKRAIDETQISEKGGAGLGLLDVAMKSHSNLYATFTKINDELSYYTLEVKFQFKIK